MSKREIYIPVLYTAEAECDIIREICAGLEEEGVPFITEFCSENLDATELAVRAAFFVPAAGRSRCRSARQGCPAP